MSLTKAIRFRESAVSKSSFSVSTRGRLTVRTLGGDALRQFGGFANSDLVLGADPQHVLVAGDQSDDAELADAVRRRADWYVRRLGRVALLDDVPRDRLAAVRLWSAPAQRYASVGHLGYCQAARHARSSWKQHQQRPTSSQSIMMLGRERVGS